MPAIDLTITDAKKQIVLEYWDRFPLFTMTLEMWNKIKPFYKKQEHTREMVATSLNNTWKRLLKDARHG